MGGSASTSSNVANLVTNVVSNVSSNIMSNQSASGDQNQVISIIGGSGDVDINGNSQNQKVTINMDALAKAMSSQTVQQDIVQKLSQAASSTVSGISMFENTDSDNTMNAFLNVGLNVASNIGQICAASGKQTQEITINQRNGKIVIENNTQDQIASIVAKCIQDATSSNAAVQSVQQTMDQQSVAKTEGVSMASLIILLIIVAIIMALPVIIPAFTAINIIFKLLFPIIMIVGGVLIYEWHQSEHDDISGVGFSTLISNDIACNATVYKTSSEYKTSKDAATACLNDKNCVALDWVPPGQTTFYSHVGENPCSRVKGDTKGASFMEDPVIIEKALSAGDVPDKTLGDEKDVFIESNTGRFYWKVGGVWKDQGILPLFTPGAAIIYNSKDPDINEGHDGDVFINTSESWNIYKKDKGSWDQEKPVVSSTASELNDSFPGKRPKAPKTNEINWSGFKTSTKKSFLLYLGICLIILGLMGTIISFTSGKKSSENNSSNVTTS